MMRQLVLLLALCACETIGQLRECNPRNLEQLALVLKQTDCQYVNAAGANFAISAEDAETFEKVLHCH